MFCGGVSRVILLHNLVSLLTVRKSIRRVVLRCLLAWLSVLREADATATTTSSLASLKSRVIFTFLVSAYPGCPGKEAIKQMFVDTVN